MSPYFGNRTILSFAMYSNLVVEGDRGNHLIVPSSLIRLTDELNDLVKIESTNLPYFRVQLAHKKDGWIPFIELRRALDYKTKDNVAYFVRFSRKNGEQWI